jgi:hypothetical protein
VSSTGCGPWRLANTHPMHFCTSAGLGSDLALPENAAVTAACVSRVGIYVAFQDLGFNSAVVAQHVRDGAW